MQSVSLHMREPDKIRARCGFRVGKTWRRILFEYFLYPLFSIITNETNHKGTATQLPEHLHAQAS